MRNPMAEPENHTLHLLRELRSDIKALDKKIDDKASALDTKIDRNHEEVKALFEMLRKAMVGESVLGRYATAQFGGAAYRDRASGFSPRRPPISGGFFVQIG